MAQLISVKLSRFDASPWGFRLQGGKDFGAPLQIQKVNGGSPAEKAGLQAGDSVIRVNDAELFNLRHKDAQDAIVRAGNNFQLTVQRGGNTWKPAVTPIGPTPSINSSSPATNIQPVTKTSLAARQQGATPIGTGHNQAARPFGGPQVNGVGDPSVKSIVNKQYNTPVGMYSEETIAETLSAQAEVLAGGVLGVNFKKNEKNYTPTNSEVFKMVHEIDNEPREFEPAPPPSTTFYSTSSHAVGGTPRPITPQSQRFPVGPGPQPGAAPAPAAPAQSETPKCSDCERFIVGVFVRIKDKNLHVECFKCATCGSSLKNVGYYNINNKLYCDIHAKLVARQHPPAPNLEPITIPPGGKAPAGAISAALSAATAPRPVSAPAPPPALAPISPSSPQPGTLGPLPFHPAKQPQQQLMENGFVSENNLKNIVTAMPALAIDVLDSEDSHHTAIVTKEYQAPRLGTSHVTAPRPVKTPAGVPAPKPFNVPSAPVTSPARPAPASNNKFVWPPKTEEEIASLTATATPLYISPNPVQQQPRDLTPTQQIQNQQRQQIQKQQQQQGPPQQQKVPSQQQILPQQQQVPPQPKQQIPVQQIQSQQLPPQTHHTSQVPFPQPYSDFISTQKSLRVRPVSTSGVPQVKTVPKPRPVSNILPQSTEGLYRAQPYYPQDTEPKLPQVELVQVENIQGSQAQSQSLTEDQRLKKASVCSQEVSVITESRAVEKISESLDTQMLVSSIAQAQERPASPVPMQEARPSTPAAPSVVQQQESRAKIVTQVSQEIQQVSQISSISQTKQAIAPTTESAPLSGIASDEPQKLQSQLLSALITAPDRPYSPLPSVTLAQTLTTQTEIPPGLSYKQLPLQPSEGFRPISLDQQAVSQEILSQETSNISAAITVASSNPPVIQPFAIPAPVPLPKQSAPYQPKLEIASQAASRPESCPSPMLSALTIAPDRPYSPLPGATKPQTPVPIQSPTVSSQAPTVASQAVAPMKKVPGIASQAAKTIKPSQGDETQLTLPSGIPLQAISMASALTIAPDRPYSPLVRGAQPLNIIVPSEASAFKAVSPKPITTGPKVASPQSIPSQPKTGVQSVRVSPQANLIKPLPKSSIPRPKSVGSVPTSPHSSTHSSLPVMGGFRPTVPTGDLKPREPDDSDYQSPLFTNLPYSPITTLAQTPNTVVQSESSAFTAVPPKAITTLPKLASPKSISSQPKIIPVQSVGTGSRTLPQANLYVIKPLPTSSFIPRSRSVGAKSASPAPRSTLPVMGGFRPTVPTGDLKPREPEEPEYQPPLSVNLQTTYPPPSPLFQQRTQTPISGGFGSQAAFQQTRSSLASQSMTQRSQPLTTVQVSTDSSGAQVTVKRTTHVEESSTVSHKEIIKRTGASSTQAQVQLQQTAFLQKQGEISQQKQQQDQKQYSLHGVQKPSVIPFYQQDIERYQMQRAISPALYAQQAQKRASPALGSRSPVLGTKSPGFASPLLAGPKIPVAQPRPQSQPQLESQQTAPPSLPTSAPNLQQPQNASQSYPFPNIPLPEGISADSIARSTPTKSSVPLPLQPTPPPPSVYQAPPSAAPQPQTLPAVPLPLIDALKGQPQNLPKPSISASKSSPSTQPSLATLPSSVTKTPVPPTSSSIPNAGGGIGGSPAGPGGPGSQKGSATFAGATAPHRGRGVLTQQTPGTRIALCGFCNNQIRGPFITALGKIWCPDHFVCVNGQCRRPLQDIGFVEEKGDLYCEYCFEQFIAPSCNKCSKKIKGDCLNAIGQHFHPECFLCAYCGKLFGNNPFFLEDGLPYCEADWNELFTTKCFACGFPIEAGDRWVEALSNNYHSQCFNCTNCKKNLEGQSFYAKGGRPFCKAHAR